MRLSLEYFFSNESCEDFSLLARLWSTSIVRLNKKNIRQLPQEAYEIDLLFS